MQAARSIPISGLCTIVNVETCHEQLLVALEGAPVIDLDLSGVTEADVTLVQLVLATRRSAEQRGRGFAVSSLSDAASRVFERAGVVPAPFEPLTLRG